MGKPRSRITILSEDVSQEVTEKILKRILEINENDRKILEEDPEYVPDPIQLVVNSFGGSVYDGLAIVGAIQSSKTPVHTVCYGSAMSMALYILVSGHHRRMSKFATLMYHEIGTTVAGKLNNIQSEIGECNRLEEICDKILVENSYVKKKDLSKMKKCNSEWYISAKKAIELGIVDEIF
jgi:ATP-dependent Clp protease protease subunit